VFFDTDTLITGALNDVPFDFDRPSASLRVEGTWPQPQLYEAGYTHIWKSLYQRFGLDFASSLDMEQPDEVAFTPYEPLTREELRDIIEGMMEMIREEGRWLSRSS